jgi:hypothetical protein
MNPGNQVRVLALAGLVCALPGLAFGQSLKSALVGTWLVTSVADQYDSGQKMNHWGTVRGNLSFDAGGRFSQIIIGDTQATLKSPDPRKPDAPVVAYYGTYAVNEAAKTVSFTIEAASWSARAGTTNTGNIEINGDVMTLIGSARQDQMGTFRPRLELKRAPRL